MAREHLQGDIYVLKDGASLEAATSATEGTGFETQWFKTKSVFVAVSGNTGAVTIKIQASFDNSNWYDLTEKTYSATNATDIFSYSSFYPFMRVISETHTNATVTATITGRS